MTVIGVTGTAAAFAVMIAGGTATPKLHADASTSIPLTGTWNLDPAHTNVNFAIKHFGISTVRGRFDDVKGAIIANAQHPDQSSVSVTIAAKSIDTNVQMRDDDLRSAHYFDVATYPEITFDSTKILSPSPGLLIAVGNLTIHGVTKEVRLPFVVEGPVKDPFGGTRIGVETQVHVSRSDFGVGGKDTLLDGALAEGDDVTITISTEALPATPAPAAPK